MNENEVLAIITKIAKRLSYRFVFGCYTREDIEQEAIIIGIEGLAAYKPGSPLENFLSVHIKNRLCNFKRDRDIRLDKPCYSCPLNAYVKKGDICKAYSQKTECELYVAWKSRNEAKRNVSTPVSISALVETDYNNLDDEPNNNLYNKEIVALIEKNMTLELRPAWLQLKAGIKLNVEDFRKLQQHIKLTLEDNNVEESW